MSRVKTNFEQIVELVKAVIWPSTVVFLALFYRSEIRPILASFPSVLKRLRMGKALGAEVQLDTLEVELDATELKIQKFVLPSGEVPTLKGDSNDV